MARAQPMAVFSAPQNVNIYYTAVSRRTSALFLIPREILIPPELGAIPADITNSK